MYHTGWITACAADGRSRLFREPEPDDFPAFMRANGLELDGFAPE